MELNRKKIVIMSLDSLIGTASGKAEAEDVTDFRIRKNVIDRLSALKNVSRIILTHRKEEKVYHAQLKAIEFFVFVYCKMAVFIQDKLDNIADSLPHSLRRKELILTVGDKEASEMYDTDYMDLDEFVCTR